MSGKLYIISLKHPYTHLSEASRYKRTRSMVHHYMNLRNVAVKTAAATQNGTTETFICVLGTRSSLRDTTSMVRPRHFPSRRVVKRELRPKSAVPELCADLPPCLGHSAVLHNTMFFVVLFWMLPDLLEA
jgi:hypothetical protein